MSCNVQRTRGMRAVGIACAIATMFGAVAIAGATGDQVDDKKAIVLDAEAILDRWEPVAKAAGGATPYWREQYATQLRQLPDYLVEQIAALDPLPDNAPASYRQFAQAFVNAYANLLLNPRAEDKGRMKLGSTTNDQVFVPIPPCRIVDTRNIGGPIGANTARNFYFYSTSGGYSWSSQGGAAGTALSSCPGTVTGGTLGNVAPSAAVATVTVVNATAAGNWLVWGGAGDPPGITASTLNWSAAGQVLANTTVIPWGGRTGTGLGGDVLDFGVKYNGPGGQADVIVDIIGYFVENRATALQCLYLTASGSGSVASGNYVIVSTPSCTAGYTKTGTGCYHQSSGIPLTVTSPDFFNRCTWVNNSGATLNASLYRAQTVCCRVPGQ